MAVQNAQNQISEQVLSWDGITAHPHRFGGTEYRLGKREIGHIHGDHLVDIPFPKKVRNAVVESGQAEAHHVLPESGWVSFYLRQPDDVEAAIALLQESLDLAMAQRARREQPQ